jgi:hypothetical protein
VVAVSQRGNNNCHYFYYKVYLGLHVALAVKKPHQTKGAAGQSDNDEYNLLEGHNLNSNLSVLPHPIPKIPLRHSRFCPPAHAKQGALYIPVTHESEQNEAVK